MSLQEPQTGPEVTGVAHAARASVTRIINAMAVCARVYCSCQISTRFPVRIGISTRLRLTSYPISAGLGTPLMIFVPCVLSNRVIDESVQLDTTTFPPIISTPSNPPTPLAMTWGARSPGFHASTDLVGPYDTMIN